jgi:dTDP-glucose 4,6-dehydratase
LHASVKAMVHYRGDGSKGWLDASDLAGEMEIVAGDIRDRDAVFDAVKGTEVVMHLAALIAIPHSYGNPWSHAATNGGGALNILQAARHAGSPLVVHTSSSEVYGSARYVPMDENHPIQVQSPYAASKAGADALAASFHRSYGLPVVIVRPFNTFGPRQSARAIVPTIIAQALDGRLKLGNLYPRRDLNYVSNTVDGFLTAAQCPKAVGRVINLGSGRDISIGDLAGLIVDQMGHRVAMVQDAARERPESSEVDRLCCDNTLARELLGWDPRVSLEEGLLRTIEWMRVYQAMYRAREYAV